MDAPPPIGRKIKRARERLRWTQEQLGSAVGVSQKTIDNWENDRRYPKSAIGALEEVLGVSFDSEEPPADPEEESARLRREVEQLKAEVQAWREVALEVQKGKGDDSTESRYRAG